MAFDFLGNDSGGGGIADAAAGGYQIYRALKGRKGSKEVKGARDAAKRSAKLADKAGDPSSKRFKNLASLYDEQNRLALVQAIDKVMRVAARSKARGDAGFAINPERRDESRYRALARAFMESKDRSRIEARNTLLGQSQALQGAAGAYPVGAGERRGEGNFDLMTTGISSLPPFVKGVRDIFRQGGQTPISQGGTTRGPSMDQYSRQPYSL